MYLKNSFTYYRGTEQCTTRGLFLLLLQDKDKPIGPENFRAVVRKVALRQLGHFMMGRVNIGGKWHTVSGTYGDDGLPMTVDTATFECGTPVPEELYEAWSKGGGWNSCGNEAAAMREWALKTFNVK